MNKIFLIAAVLFISFISCTTNNYKYHSVRFENRYHEEISIIKMNTKSGSQIVSRLLSPGSIRIYSLGNAYPANDIYEIEWKYSDGKKFHKKIDLREQLPEDFKGHVVFSFNKDDDVNFYQWMSPNQYDYSVELENKSKTTIYNPFMRSSGGVLFVKYKDELKVGDEIKVWNLKSFPANSVYTISWTTVEGKSYSETFDFRDKLKEDFSSIIQFTINRSDKIEYSID